MLGFGHVVVWKDQVSEAEVEVNHAANKQTLPPCDSLKCSNHRR